MKLARPRPTTLTVLAATAAVIAVGSGSAVAATLITSAQIQDGTIQSVDVKDGGLTGTDIKSSSINGSDILNGSLTREDTKVYWAVVTSAGVLARSSGTGIVATDLASLGRFSVTFPRDITTCAAVTQIASPDSTSPADGFVHAEALVGNDKGIYVNTTDITGTQADRPFALIVTC